MPRPRSIALLVFCLALSATPTRADDAPSLYRRNVRSVALVRGAKNCTGWLFDRERKLLVSSARGIGKDDTVQVCFPELKDDKLIAERDYYDGETKSTAGKVIARDLKRDLALIQLDAVPDDVAPLKLADGSVTAGDRLHAILNTAASRGLWGYSTGLVRQIYRKKETLQGAPLDARVVLSQLPINPGDSGGPLFNDAGELAAVAVAAVDKTRLVTIAIEVGEVRQFLSKFAADADKKKAPPAQEKKIEAKPGSSGKASYAADFEKLLPATVWIVTARAKDGFTGCLVDRKRKFVLTAARMIGEDEAVKVWFPSYSDGKLIGAHEKYLSTLDPIQARVIRCERRSGLALLMLESIPESAAELTLASNSAVPGDDVHSIGNPIFTTGLWVFQQGVVRQVFQQKAKLKDGDFDARVLQTQTPYNPGDAGSPVVNGKGQLVGLVDNAVQGAAYVTRCIDFAEISDILKNAAKDKE